MGDGLTAEQVRTEAINAMGCPLGEIYHALSDEVSWLHLKWNDFRELFAEPENVELFNAAAPVFFHDLQRQTWEDVLLHLCRITDPPKSSGKSNLTIRCLPTLDSEPPLRASMESIVDDVIQKTVFARDWRNRRLAHKELVPDQPLASASVDHVGDALAAVRMLMNQLEQHYLNKTVSYEQPIPALGGVASFITVLRKGVETRRAERKARLRIDS